MKDMDNKIDIMIKLYRLKLNGTVMRYGLTAPETVACSQVLDKWVFLAVARRNSLIKTRSFPYSYFYM